MRIPETCPICGSRDGDTVVINYQHGEVEVPWEWIDVTAMGSDRVELRCSNCGTPTFLAFEPSA